MASAVALGLLGGLVLSGIAVRVHVGALVDPLPVIRIGAALAIAATAGSCLPPGGKALTLVYAAIVGIVYLVVLVVSREISSDDLALVKRVLGRKAAS